GGGECEGRGGDEWGAGKGQGGEGGEGRTGGEAQPEEAGLPDLDPEVEGKKRGRYRARRETAPGERPREAEAMEESEEARHEPGRPPHERGPRMRVTRQLHRQEEDTRRDADLDGP